MKKILAATTLFCAIISFNANARDGVSVSSSGTLGYVHYSDDYEQAFGFNVGHTSASNKDIGATSLTKVGIFARMGEKIANKTYLYGGLSNYWTLGRDNGSKIDYKYTISPYATIEYHVTENFFVRGGTNLVTFEQEKYKGQNVTTSYSYFGSFVGASYLF